MGLFDFFKSKPSPKVVKESPANTVSVSPKPQVQVTHQIEEVPSLQSRLQNCTPSKMGLYPHEIMMLYYAHTYKTSGNTFQAFWKFKYSVLNPQSVLDSLIHRGFIKAGNVKDCLEKLKVSEIKDLLTKVNQKTTGKKAELVERVLDSYSNEVLEKMVNAACNVAKEQGFSAIYLMSGEVGLYEEYSFTKVGDYKTIYGSVDQLFSKTL